MREWGGHMKRSIRFKHVHDGQDHYERPNGDWISLIFIVVTTLILAGLTSYILRTDRVYTHFFYIPIAICAAKYPRYTLHLGLFFSVYHLALEQVLRGSFGIVALVRVAIIISVALLLKSIWIKEKNYLQTINQLDHASSHDCMTEVLNRRGLEVLLGQEQIAFPITLVMCDVNGLKMINDHYGHASGDMVIKQTAAILKASTRQGDIVARIGGDEFLLVLQKCKKEAAIQVILRIEAGQAAYNNQVQMSKNKQPRISIACGLAEASERCQWELALQASDEAMYLNKQAHYNAKRGLAHEKNHTTPLV